MKLFVVVVSVAVVIMFVFATNTAAAPTDFEDTHDMILLSAPVGGRPYVLASSSSSGSSSKSSSKHPVLELIKSVIKLLTKMFSYSDATIPIGPGIRQHRSMLA